MSRPVVYLAGPIAGCNEDQIHSWRRGLKHGFSEEFEFVDPAENLIADDKSDYDLVKADAEDIAKADAVLAYMWRESIGTAIGVVHAQREGRIVVVCDPNFIKSRVLGFYADAVVRSLPAGLAAIRTLLKAQNTSLMILGEDDKAEHFDRLRLMKAVRDACIAAHQSDIVPPRAIAMRALDSLLADPNGHKVLTKKEVYEAVWEAIADLASEPHSQTNYEAIRLAWEARSQQAPLDAPPAAMTPQDRSITVHEKPLKVRVGSVGTHSTIWGHRPGAQAAAILLEMARVEGLSEIRLTQFTNTGSPPNKPHVRLQASRTPGVIEGRMYDKGPKGTLQTFQVIVSNAVERDLILEALRKLMLSLGHMRPVLDQ